MKKHYKIAIDGCDDSTYVEMKLTESEWQVINRLCLMSVKKSDYQCMPTMSITELNKEGK